MISDDSSSDSETGRFKCHTKKQDAQSSTRKDSDFRSSDRNRRSDRPRVDRFHRDSNRCKDERRRYERRSRERSRTTRYSPIHRRKHSRDRSVGRTRKSAEPRQRRRSRPHSRPRDNRSHSKNRKKHSSSVSQTKTEPDKNLLDLRDTIALNSDKTKLKSASSENIIRKSQERRSASILKKSESPIHVIDEEESDKSEGLQPASYYKMIPVVKDKSENSSVTDSSDDEKLRAKLLNLEKELRKTRKKKHKKKHKKRTSKNKSKDRDVPVSVEVTSTTDILLKNDPDHTTDSQLDAVEVTSTQSKSNKKESCEEGEISSDNSDKESIDIDASDLRHKLKRSVQVVGGSISPDLREKLKAKNDVCGPALPPHLERKFHKSDSSDVEEVEGPALPPHSHGKRSLGPTIPNKMRKVLADADYTPIKNESSEEDDGIGPVPVGSEITSVAQHQLEERALSMKIKQLDGHSLQNTDVKAREQWMLELPEGKAKYLGLEARQFRSKEGPDMSDRSCWTDTPEQRARKEAGLPAEGDSSAALQSEARAKLIAERDAEHETAIKKHKKKHKRDESLLDMHQKKLKKKKKKEEKGDGQEERRPFNRETDLQANRFDEAQKKAIIKKAQHLDSRFASGEAKYL